MHSLPLDAKTFAVCSSNCCSTCPAQLHSKEDSTRKVAAEGCLNLAKQCSDPTAVEKLVKLLFAVLNGMPSKFMSVPK